MGKLRRDLAVAMAGACSGLFAVSVFLLAARVVSFYEYLGFRETNGYATRYNGVEDLWWMPVVLWHVVLSILASLLINRYLASGRASIFLRWQAIGLVALCGWGLTLFIGTGLECLLRGNSKPIDEVFSLFAFAPVTQFVAAVFASNVLFGSAIQAASTETRADSIEPESQPPVSATR